MEFMDTIRHKIEANGEQFLKAINVLRRNPHVANRRILASKEILATEVDANVDETLKLIEASKVSCFARIDSVNEIEPQWLLTVLGIVSSKRQLDPSNNTIGLYIAKLLPRSPSIFSESIQIMFVEREKSRVSIVEKSLYPEKRSLTSEKVYKIQLEEDGYVSMMVYRSKESSVEHEDSSSQWLKEKLFQRLIAWMKNSTPTTRTGSPTVSLSLVPVERYAFLYRELKRKYGPDTVRIWPESTDPTKFVYEELAIAAYLLLLWEIERAERGTRELQSFLDLGCGNGLLVRVLHGEGHSGRGIDLRKRKIWNLFPADTPLEVRTIVPSSTTVFPGVDWIIGNHSDELTPWIPVFAARSSADCRFFVLPCCPYEFDGTKYRRHCADRSQYSEYIDYVKNISIECGFETRVDRLRIPSTKRICLIGWSRKYQRSASREEGEEGLEEKQEEKQKGIQDRLETARENRIREMIGARTKLILAIDQKGSQTAGRAGSTDCDAWSCNFKPREAVEKVRNCTRLDRTVTASIIGIVARQLLQDGRRITIDETADKTWNAGRRLELGKIVDEIPRESLLLLRQECGGLQTLLRNRSEVFNVVRGKVEFKIPGRERSSERKRVKTRKKFMSPRRKVKPCWFHENHPDGCPTDEATCTYKH